MLHALDAILGPAYFWLFGGIATLCALGLLVTRHPLHGAFCLIGTMLSLSGLYALLGSPFLAVLQVLVYAGGVMTLVVFVIMVLNQAKDSAGPAWDGFGLVALALPLVLGLMVVRVLALAGPAPPVAPERGTVAALAGRLFDFDAAGPGQYLLFLLLGVVLLAAVAAAVSLAKRRLDRPAAPAPDGEGAEP
jgi:NADH-quinone oxidoreductase subunit J